MGIGSGVDGFLFFLWVDINSLKVHISFQKINLLKIEINVGFYIDFLVTEKYRNSLR